MSEEEGFLNFRPIREDSEWTCYMFGGKPDGFGMIYIPSKGHAPNLFVRWMMKICFDCTWVKNP